MCTMYGSGAIGGQKMESDPLVLELRMVVSHHVCDGNQMNSCSHGKNKRPCP